MTIDEKMRALAIGHVFSDEPYEAEIVDLTALLKRVRAEAIDECARAVEDEPAINALGFAEMIRKLKEDA